MVQRQGSHRGLATHKHKAARIIGIDLGTGEQLLVVGQQLLEAGLGLVALLDELGKVIATLQEQATESSHY